MSFLAILTALYGLGCALSQSLMSLAGTMAVGTLIVLGVRRRPVKTWPRAERVALTAGLTWVAFSALNLGLRTADEHTLHTLGNLPLLLAPLAALTSLAGPQERGLRRALTLAAIALAVSVGIGAWQFAHGMAAQGLLHNPIYYGYNLLPALAAFTEIALGRVPTAGFSRRAAGALVAGLWLGIALSISRMPLLCATLYLAVRALPMARERWGTTRTLGALFALAAVASLGVARNELLREKFTRSLSTHDVSREWRERAWAHSFELFRNAPLMGVGPERNAIDPARQPEFTGHWMPNHRYYAHSIYLQSLADNGLIGTLLLLTFWIALGVAAPPARPLLILMAAAGLTENIFNNSKAAHALYFYAFLLVLLGRPLRESRAT
jgi:O-antigen ligase